MTRRSRFKPGSIAVSVGVLLLAMVSTQLGVTLAKGLFSQVGAAGAAALRLALAAAMLLVWRPWRMRPSMGEARSIVLYGVAMGCMNLFFYRSIERIPLGIAVALEFTGPLGVAMAGSRRAIDFAWIALAALGVLALLPVGGQSKSLDPVGIGFAFGAGVCWAMYIVFGQKAGHVNGGQAAALGTLVAAVLIVPVGVAHAGAALLTPAILPAACAVALLSSALPYSLEMYALTRVPARTFGVLMSAEPAMGALAGLMFLGESLSAVQWAAIASVMCASAGSAATSGEARLPVLAE